MATIVSKVDDHDQINWGTATVPSFALQDLYVLMALNQIQSLLKSPDEVKVVLEATFVITPESDSQRDLQNRRILAVLSHKDDWDLTEEGT